MSIHPMWNGMAIRKSLQRRRLQLPRHAVAYPDLVASQYRRLTLLLNPHRNRLPSAAHGLKIVSDAWSDLEADNEDLEALWFQSQLMVTMTTFTKGRAR
ncbi:hypothetical protein RHSIM_Rhsim06G0142800 [Rhododendron simsii]|uniref:Uncharacterized protein n=1 Tax=Rhododendron simsii TaxID=118357 RepID=A0A834GRK4_RHOSS|nr:hypothetical protein RHSIM_Rhsim06G0142800 [Rhododendron simsii]